MNLTKYQTAKDATPRATNKIMQMTATINLNLRYRFSSGGASELCGKYGGGV
jgi:hypothetical protein